jgi:small subunit ribosomal protein S2
VKKGGKNMSVISMKQLLEAGVHFGHQSKKWNPKMRPFIFTARNNIHIINLEETSSQVDKAYEFVKNLTQGNGTILFVGTKKQAQEVVKEEATRCGMFYVNTRWLGGTLTNFKTIKASIERLNKLNQAEKVGEFDLLPKKEATLLRAQRDKLEKNLGGIKEMHGLPSVIFVVDPTVERICVREAKALGIPVVAIVDTNSDPSNIDCVIPANDDAVRSVKLITSALADAVIEAKEGISPKAVEQVEEEMVDIKTVLDKTVPNLELAESGEDEPAKPRKKKPAKKPAVKAEKPAEKPAEKTEVKAENKEEK